MSDSAQGAVPFVSVIIPTRNEGRFISACLDSVLNGDYPLNRLEFVIVDALSTDGTRELIRQRISDAVPLRVLDDRERNIPRALNAAIRAARGSFLVRLDAHNIYAEDYIRRCVERLVRGEADMVGGVWHVVPRTNGAWGRAVAAVLTEPFGVGNAHYRTRKLTEPTLVDTVPYFACGREFFDRFGLYDDDIPGSEDMVYNLRVRKRGGRILLDPEIQSWYHARTELKAFVRHNLRNGFWAVLPLAWGVRFRARHFTPLVFVAAITVLSATWLFQGRFGWMLAVVLGTYLAAATFVSLRTAVRQRAPLQLVLMPLAFAVLHVFYGIGSLAGLGALAFKMLRSKAERSTAAA